MFDFFSSQSYIVSVVQSLTYIESSHDQTYSCYATLNQNCTLFELHQQLDLHRTKKYNKINSDYNIQITGKKKTIFYLVTLGNISNNVTIRWIKFVVLFTILGIIPVVVNKQLKTIKIPISTLIQYICIECVYTLLY